MKWLKQGSKAWRLVTLALIAVPWFFRDQLAVTLEERTQEAQQVLSGLETEQLRQQQDLDQRDVRQALLRIEVAASKAAGIIDKKELRNIQVAMAQEAAGEEVEALRKSVRAFNALLQHSNLGADIEAKWAAKAAGATKFADTLEKFDPNAVPEGAGADGLDDKAYEKATQDLAEAYQGLYNDAEAARESSASTAQGARFIAWLFTAVGGFMLGGGTGLLGGGSAQPGKEEEPAPSA